MSATVQPQTLGQSSKVFLVSVSRLKREQFPELATPGLPFSRPFIRDWRLSSDGSRSSSLRKAAELKPMQNGTSAPFGFHFQHWPDRKEVPTIKITGGYYDLKTQTFITSAAMAGDPVPNADDDGDTRFTAWTEVWTFLDGCATLDWEGWDEYTD